MYCFMHLVFVALRRLLLEQDFVIVIVAFVFTLTIELLRVSYCGRFLSASAHTAPYVCSCGEQTVRLGWPTRWYSPSPQQWSETSSDFLRGCVRVQAGDVSEICTLCQCVKVINNVIASVCKNTNIVILDKRLQHVKIWVWYFNWNYSDSDRVRNLHQPVLM